MSLRKNLLYGDEGHLVVSSKNWTWFTKSKSDCQTHPSQDFNQQYFVSFVRSSRFYKMSFKTLQQEHPLFSDLEQYCQYISTCHKECFDVCCKKKFKFLLKLCCIYNDHLWQVECDGVGHDWNNEGAGRELLPKGGNFILFCSVFGLIVLHSVCCWFLFFLQHFRSRSRLIDLEISLRKRSTLWSRKRSTTWHWGKNISLVQNV